MCSRENLEQMTEFDDEKICRYCFDGEESGDLISPCKCTGGSNPDIVELFAVCRTEMGPLGLLKTMAGISNTIVINQMKFLFFALFSREWLLLTNQHILHSIKMISDIINVTYAFQIIHAPLQHAES